MAIRFTHGYDLIVQISTMLGGMVLLSTVSEVIKPIAAPVGKTMEDIGLDWAWILIIICYIVGGYIGAILLLRKTLLPDWLPTYMYVWASLYTKISPREARTLSFLFDGRLQGTWYPLTSIQKIDPSYRREALFRFANQVAAERHYRKPFEMPEDLFDGKHDRTPESKHKMNWGQSHLSQGRELPLRELKVLGLEEMPESLDLIKKAYKRKVSQFHPDRFQGERPEVIVWAEETTKQLNAAYSKLEKYCSNIRR